MTQKSVSLKKKLIDHNHDKYLTTPEFNTLAADLFNARLAQANLITKTDYRAKISEIESKIPSIRGSATNAELTTVENT